MNYTLTPHSLRNPGKDIDDQTFIDNAKWLAFSRNSLQWPNHWRAVIFRIQRVCAPLYPEPVYVVWPRNPEYDAYMDKIDQDGQGMDLDAVPPPMHLGPVEFKDMDEINAWAVIAARMAK